MKRPQAEETAAIDTALALDSIVAEHASSHADGVMLVAAILVAGIVGGAYFWFGQSATKISYTTVPVEIGKLTVEVSATGTLQPLTQVDISSELSGVVRSVAVNENQNVKKGDVLAVLDTARLSAQIERAEASAKAAEAKVTDTQDHPEGDRTRRWSRATQLSSRGMVADQALETATAARDRAEAPSPWPKPISPSPPPN